MKRIIPLLALLITIIYANPISLCEMMGNQNTPCFISINNEVNIFLVEDHIIIPNGSTVNLSVKGKLSLVQNGAVQIDTDTSLYVTLNLDLSARTLISCLNTNDSCITGNFADIIVLNQESILNYQVVYSNTTVIINYQPKPIEPNPIELSETNYSSYIVNIVKICFCTFAIIIVGVYNIINFR